MPRIVVEAVHVDQIREHGGMIGLRDVNALESALARPQQRWHYVAKADLASLAAAYAFGLSTSHPFQDGNKRVAFVTAVVFLTLNEAHFTASQDEVVEKSMALAAGQLDEDALAEWFRSQIDSAQ